MKQHNILIDCILLIITFGIWNIYMQYRQIQDMKTFSTNYSFLKWALLSLITFGIYHVYHEYKMTKDICLFLEIPSNRIYALFSAIGSLSGLWIIVDLFQQDLLNDIVSKRNN